MTEDNKIFKTNEFSIEISPVGKAIQAKDIQYFSYDENSGLQLIHILMDGKPLDLPNGTEIRLSAVKLNNQNQKLIYTPEIVDPLKGIVSFVIPREFLGYQGQIRCGLYINFSNNQTMHVGYFYINMGVSDIDTNLTEFTEDFWQGWSEFEADSNAKMQELERRIDEQTEIFNNADVYNKAEIEDKLEPFALQTDIDTLEIKKADKIALAQTNENIENLDSTKADKTDIRNKDIPIGLNDMSPEVLEAISGNSASFDVLSIPRDLSVVPEKTNFLDVDYHKNIFNKITVTRNSEILETNGTVIPGTARSVSDYIRVLPNTEYTMTSSGRTAFYNEAYTFVSGINGSNTFKTPSTAAFVRTTILDAYLDVFQIELGKVKTPYEPYQQPTIKLKTNVEIDDLDVGLINDVGGRWTTSGTDSYTKVQDQLTYISSGTSKSNILNNKLTEIPDDGDKIYVRCQFKAINTNAEKSYIHYRDWNTGGTFDKYWEISTSGEVFNLSDTFEAEGSFVGMPNIYVIFNPKDSSYTGEAFNFKEPLVYNLTKMFGSGNEPDAGTIDAILENIDDEGKISVKRFLVKALEKQTNNTSLEAIDQIRKSNKGLITKTRSNVTISSTRTKKKRKIWTITYDDDAKNIYDYALPIHRAENVQACFYIIPDHIGNGLVSNYGATLNWNEVHELKDAGWEIGNHTFNHRNTSYMDEAQLIDNIEKANELFIKQGIYPDHFSHPGGSNTFLNTNILQEYFSSAALTENGINSFDLNPWRLKRRSSDAYYSSFASTLDQLNAMEEGWLISYHHAIHPDGEVIGSLGSMECWTPQQLQTAIQYAKSLDIEIVNLTEGLQIYAPYLYLFDSDCNRVFSVQRDGQIINK